jgi:predicted Rossmann-fold nucleotide-binding protein
MLQESDVMVALPGGIGTLDEVFHVMAACSIGYHQKKVIFYNVEGFWNDLLAFLNRLNGERICNNTQQNGRKSVKITIFVRLR